MIGRHFRFAPELLAPLQPAPNRATIKASRLTGRRIMLRKVVLQPFLKISAISLLLIPATYGQSLGDVARENREKSASDPSSISKPKVITNADLPKAPETDQATPQAETEAGSADAGKPADRTAANQRSADRHFAEQRRAEQRAAEQWKKQILAQKAKISTLQARIDKLNASIHFIDGTVYYEAPYNQYQARQLEKVREMQQQLEEEKSHLADMQEAARRAGMHTPVYDP